MASKERVEPIMPTAYTEMAPNTVVRTFLRPSKVNLRWTK